MWRENKWRVNVGEPNKHQSTKLANDTPQPIQSKRSEEPTKDDDLVIVHDDDDVIILSDDELDDEPDECVEVQQQPTASK